MPRSTPATDRCESFLYQHARDCRAQGTLRLPKALDLARMGGFSHVTVLRAARRLQAKNVLSIAHCRGITLSPAFVSGAGIAGVGAVPFTGRKRGVARLLADDIVGGRYCCEEHLPSRKVLQVEYGVCRQTLSRALCEVEKMGLIRLVGSRIITRQGVPRRSADTVMLVGCGKTVEEMQSYSPRAIEHLGALERECSVKGLQLVIVTCDPITGRLFGACGGADSLAGFIPSARVLLGTMVWENGLGNKILSQVFSQLTALGQPMAIFDESSRTQDWPLLLPYGSKARVFSVATDRACGEQVGAFLLSCGYARVAFVSPVHGASWSRARLAGIESVFHRYASSHSPILPCTFNYGSQQELARQSTVLHTTCKRMAEIAKVLAVLPSTLFTGGASQVQESEILRQRLPGLLSPLLERKEYTVWVVASDSIAALCLEYLRTRKIAVPGQIAIVSFDDTHQALLARLTSYNFNGSGALRAMMSYLLTAPPARGGRSPCTTVTVSGFVTVRDSCAPSPRGRDELRGVG